MPETASRSIPLDSREEAILIFGPRDQFLRLIRDALGVRIVARGDLIQIDGPDEAVGQAERAFQQLRSTLRHQGKLANEDVRTILEVVRAGSVSAAPTSQMAMLDGGKYLRARTDGQGRYVQAMRDSDVTICIGPAGTGKTFMAVGMAVTMLRQGVVKKIVLVRPAVEAGERLGFLPGDMAAKVNPYLRPLFDSLNDMMEGEQVKRYTEADVIEIAPLAFMRGRAQPLTSKVLTPDGFRPIGSIRVGDYVVGSDGRPTAVLGVFPQGRKDVFRLTATDGASTRCCAEHLWSVRRLGESGPRVLQISEMVAGLDAGAVYGLPLVAASVEMAARDVGGDPYKMGRRVASASGGRQPPESRVKGGASANRTRGADAPRSPQALVAIPQACLTNTPAVRVAFMQGILDVAGTPTSAGSVHCPVTGEVVRNALVFLVRSLGGTARWRARGEDLFVFDIRLPSGVAPFRKPRKAARYNEFAGVGPARAVASIEPDGSEECVCISVAAADSLYVTDDFLVTHNTLNNAAIILDEGQNCTVGQMKMFLTRMGHNSKVIVTGDMTQNDLPPNVKSGLADAVHRLKGIPRLSIVYLDESDIVRHPMVSQIVKAYDEPKK